MPKTVMQVWLGGWKTIGFRGFYLYDKSPGGGEGLWGPADAAFLCI